MDRRKYHDRIPQPARISAITPSTMIPETYVRADGSGREPTTRPIVRDHAWSRDDGGPGR
jgi:hypothetical protein